MVHLSQYPLLWPALLLPSLSWRSFPGPASKNVKGNLHSKAYPMSYRPAHTELWVFLLPVSCHDLHSVFLTPPDFQCHFSAWEVTLNCQGGGIISNRLSADTEHNWGLINQMRLILLNLKNLHNFRNMFGENLIEFGNRLSVAAGGQETEQIGSLFCQRPCLLPPPPPHHL